MALTWIRRGTLTKMAVAIPALALLAACQSGPAASSSQPASQAAARSAGAEASASAAPSALQGWQQLVEAARKEGTLALSGPQGAESRVALLEAFEKAYPGIKVQATFGTSDVLVNRVMTERAARRYDVDVLIHGTGDLVTTFKDAGVSVPLKPKLMLPEVLDESGWLNRHLWWSDSAEPYTNLMFMGQVGTIAFYNKKTVDPSLFKSYWDFLDPKWKGKIVATDVRGPGPGAANARWMFKNPKLGPTYLERLFGEMDVTFSADQRQMIDWVAQGQYPIGLLLSPNDAGKAEQQGLAIGLIPGKQFTEGVPLTGGTGSVIMADQAPHSNAAQLYVNWLLSKEGQGAWERDTKQPSLRVDLPRVELLAEKPQAGVDYANANSEEYARLSSNAVRDVINSGLKKAGRS